MARGVLIKQRGKGLLENATRRKIYSLVRENPGSSQRDLKNAAEVSPGTTQYHLAMLAYHGLVKEVKENCLKYYPLDYKVENTPDSG